MFDHIPGRCGPTKLTHYIKHHSNHVVGTLLLEREPGKLALCCSGNYEPTTRLLKITNEEKYVLQTRGSDICF